MEQRACGPATRHQGKERATQTSIAGPLRGCGNTLNSARRLSGVIPGGPAIAFSGCQNYKNRRSCAAAQRQRCRVSDRARTLMLSYAPARPRLRLILFSHLTGLAVRRGISMRMSGVFDGQTSPIRFSEEPVREGPSLRAEDEREARVFAGGTGRPQARTKGEAPHISPSACEATDVASLPGAVPRGSGARSFT